MIFSKNYTSGSFLTSFLLASAILFLLPSCEWFKPARDSSKDKVYKDDDIGDLQGTKVFDPETGEWRTVRQVSGELDTVRWSSLSEEKFPPITTGSVPSGGATTGGNTGGGATTSGTYKVSMLLPFVSQRSSVSIDENSLWAIHFYGGAKLAYDDLERTGARLNIAVADSEASSGKMDQLLRSVELNEADLIIGPYRREQVGQVEAFSRQKKIPFVVPYTAQMGLAENNPFYIQVNPSLASHCDAILQHARQRYDQDQIVLVVRNQDDEKARLKYFQDANASFEGSRAGSKLKEFVVSGDFNNINVTPYIQSSKPTVFIVPSWSSEPFIYSLLRQLMIKQSDGNDIIVYGMPSWMDFEQIDFEYYERLKVHVSSAFFVDKNDERIRQFNQQFFDAYGTVPKEEAYLGYDIMLYFGKMLNKYGRNFPARLDQEDSDVLRGRFDFERVVNEPERHREDLDYYDQLENTFVHILKFQDYHFQPAR